MRRQKLLNLPRISSISLSFYAILNCARVEKIFKFEIRIIFVVIFVCSDAQHITPNTGTVYRRLQFTNTCDTREAKCRQ